MAEGEGVVGIAEQSTGQGKVDPGDRFLLGDRFAAGAVR